MFTQPLDFDVSEVLFTLPNGLHGDMIVDASGVRLAGMPADLEQDPLLDGFVRPGQSCMGCHTRGLIAAEDDLRPELDEGMDEVIFDADTRDRIRNLYPMRAELTALISADVDDDLGAVQAAGVVVEDVEPVSATHLAFQAPLDRERAAAELWRTSDERIEDPGKLSIDLEALSNPTGTVTREVFSASFAGSVCILNLGKTSACP